MKNGWIDEMTWLPKTQKVPNGYWNKKENVLNEAKKYKSIKEFQKHSGGAFNAARKHGFFNEINWMKRNGKKIS